MENVLSVTVRLYWGYRSNRGMATGVLSEIPELSNRMMGRNWTVAHYRDARPKLLAAYSHSGGHKRTAKLEL